MNSADNYQHGGTHYKNAVIPDHWTVAYELKWDYFIAAATKYLWRFGKKNPSLADTASWYGPGFHGRTTANGERFDQNARTAAHKSLPFGTVAIVTHKGKSTVVRINDRGPFVHGRTIDLSKAAAQDIGLRGVGRVRLEVLR